MPLQDMFRRNPLAWMLFFLLCMTAYGTYRMGIQITELCSLVIPVQNIRLPSSYGDPNETPERYAFESAFRRWQETEGAELDALCAGPAPRVINDQD